MQAVLAANGISGWSDCNPVDQLHRSRWSLRLNNMNNQRNSCPACADNKGRGYLYAVMTAVLCPCHLPVFALFLGSGTASAFFAQNFLFLAITLGVLSLITFVAAVRILL